MQVNQLYIESTNETKTKIVSSVLLDRIYCVYNMNGGSLEYMKIYRSFLVSNFSMKARLKQMALLINDNYDNHFAKKNLFLVEAVNISAVENPVILIYFI